MKGYVQIPKKGLQKATSRPKPKSGQFYQQFTDGEAARQTASQAQERLVLSKLGLFPKVPGCPKPKSSQFYKQFTDWEASQPASQPSAGHARSIHTWPLWDSLCMYVCMYVCTYVSLSPTAASFTSKPHIGKPLFWRAQIPKKGLRRDPGLHKPKTGQLYLQLTYELVCKPRF